MRKNSSFNHFVMLATAVVAMLMASCIKDEVVDVPFIPTESETIGFGISLENLDDTRAASRNRVGKHDLKSADGEFTLPMGVYVEDGIHSANADKAETRGAVLGAIGDKFTVWASLANGDKSTLFFPAEGVVFEDDGTSYKSNPAYFWPGAGTLNFTAVANAPASEFTPNLNSDGTALESFTYTVPEDATAQNDIVLATASVDGANNATVPLHFDHILSAVQFRVGDQMADGEIKSIKLNNICSSGTYDVATQTWTPDYDSKESYAVKFNAYNNTTGNYTPTNTGDTMNADDAVFMMIPQQLSDDAEIVVEFVYGHDDTTVELRSNIAKKAVNGGTATENFVWNMDRTIYYTISVDENYNLIITPGGDILDAHYVWTDITINVDTQTDEAWTLEVSATGTTDTSGHASVMLLEGANSLIATEGYWLDKDDSGTSMRGSATLTGSTKGEKTVRVFIPENTSNAERTITLKLWLNSAPENVKTEYLYQKYPYWDDSNNFGWERVENTDVGTFGFNWDRVVCYTYKYTLTTGNLGGTAYKNDQYDTFNKIVDDLITAYNASGYVTKKYFSQAEGYVDIDKGTRGCVIIDYTKINGADFFTFYDEDNGVSNTQSFIKGLNNANVFAFENALASVMKSETGQEGVPAFRIPLDGVDDGYAIGNVRESSGLFGTKLTFSDSPYVDGNNKEYALTFNDSATMDDMSGILKYIIQRNSFNTVKKTISGGYYYDINMDPEKILWYLPAVNQYANPVLSFATGNATFIPENFWSSTADKDNNNNAFNGNDKSISRETELQVVVQRVGSSTQAVAVTLDNSEMAGGENGEAQWVE